MWIVVSPFVIVVGAHDLTLDVLSDVLADFLKRFTKLLRIAADAEASQRESRFPVSTHTFSWVRARVSGGSVVI